MDTTTAPDTVRETSKPAPTYRVETIPRLHSVVIYDEDHPVNYIAVCQVFCYGDVGLMFSINGPRFYDAMTRDGAFNNLLERLELRTLEGYVTPSHARLMKYALRRVAVVEEIHPGRMAGHDMVWVKVSAK